MVQAAGAGEALGAAVNHILGVQEESSSGTIVIPFRELCADAAPRFADADEQHFGSADPVDEVRDVEIFVVPFPGGVRAHENLAFAGYDDDVQC